MQLFTILQVRRKLYQQQSHGTNIRTLTYYNALNKVNGSGKI
jgi:hypothetical protein